MFCRSVRCQDRDTERGFLMRRSLCAWFAVSAVLAAGAVVAAPSADATASGHNGLIAFVRHGQIFTVDAKGHHLTQLTHAKGLLTASQPKWSPDGRHIAYVQLGAFGVPFIWEMSATGRHKHKLWKGSDPAWSPSGKTLAYLEEIIVPSTDPNPGCVYHEVFIRSVTGGPARLIDQNGLVSCTSTNGESLEYGPDIAWSQNEKLVYFGVDDIIANGPAGSSFTVVQMVIAAHTAGTDIGPTATTATVVLKRSQAGRKGQTTVPQPPTVDAAPVKDSIVYSESYPTVEVKAGRPREETANEKFITLISSARFTSFPVFSPDGKRVLYVQHLPGHSPVIRRLSLHSGKSQMLVHGTEPDWQPLP
jgi:dipeptidyl aminopeptidase/acylaminoacyl peptidase